MSKHRTVRSLHIAIVLAGGVLLLTSLTTTLEEDRLSIHADPSPELIRAEIQRHPMDYFGYALLAEQLIHSNSTDAVNVLNHALRLHPNHSGMHVVAARLLVRLGRVEQAASEYATALRNTWTQRPIIEEALRTLPTNKAAEALPLELEVDPTMRILKDAKQTGVAIDWLNAVVSYAPRLDAVQALYYLAVEKHDLPNAERAGRGWCRIVPSAQCQLSLARVLALESKPAELITVLRDVEQWHGLQQDQVEGWLLVCDAYATLNKVDEERKCLARLELSGLNLNRSELEVRRVRLSPAAANHL